MSAESQSSSDAPEREQDLSLPEGHRSIPKNLTATSGPYPRIPLLFTGLWATP